MVFGNAGGQSGAGVGFTRDPATGEPALWVDFLFNAQGEDVVSGRRSANGHDESAAVLPEVWHATRRSCTAARARFGDMQDFEFTVQDGRLFMLQTRSGKRAPQAAVRIALDMLDEGLIGNRLALDARPGSSRVARASLHRRDRRRRADPLGRAASASSGVAVGEIALDEKRAVARHEAGVAVILVRRDADTGDIRALESATGLLTQRGARNLTRRWWRGSSGRSATSVAANCGSTKPRARSSSATPPCTRVNRSPSTATRGSSTLARSGSKSTIRRNCSHVWNGSDSANEDPDEARRCEARGVE